MKTDQKTKPYYYDLFYYALFQGIPILIGFFILPLYSTQLTTEEYGQYSLIMATLNILAILSINWINVSTIRFFSEFETEEEKAKLMSISSVTLIATTLLGSGALWIIGQLGIIEIDHIMLVIFMFFVMNLERLVTSYLKAARKVKKNTVIKTIYTLLRFLVIITLLLGFQFGKEGIFWGNIIASLFVLVTGVYVAGIKVQKLSKQDVKRAKEYLSYGIPFIWILGVHWILTISDRYMIEFMVGSSAVGIYSLNYSLVQKIIMPIITIFMSTAAPIVFQQKQKTDIIGAQKTLDQIFKYFLMLTVPATLGLALVSREIGSVFIKNEFQEGFVIIPIIAFALLFLGIRQYTNIALEIEKKSKEIARISILAGVLNIILNLVLIRFFSYIGAAYATLISYMFYFFLSYFKTKSLTSIRVSFTKEFFKVILASAAMIAPLMLIGYFSDFSEPITLALKLLTGMAVYIGFVLGLGLIKPGEIKSFIQKKRKKKGV